MSDEYQVRAIRTQSSAVVSAALITTMGAVTAACIQSGWIGRPADPAASSMATATPRTTFMEPQSTFRIPVLPPAPAQRVTADKPVFEPHSTILQAEPALRPVASSNWGPATNTLAQDRPKKSGFRLWDWSAMTRFLFGQN